MNFKLRTLMPRPLRNVLWGDRERWGLTAVSDDACWVEWQRVSSEFYVENQRTGVGTTINDAGYRVMAAADIDGKTVLEIGAGDIRHIPYWTGRPRQYVLADVDAAMLERAKLRLQESGVPHREVLVERGGSLPLGDASVDLVVSFYSLEHLHPLRAYLEEMHRVLKPGGMIVGAIPAEGGLAWGAGRYCTSRRWFKKNTTIDPDKIICWEHPNFADEIVGALDSMFVRERLSFWPFKWMPLLDPNLIIQYAYRK